MDAFIGLSGRLRKGSSLFSKKEKFMKYDYLVVGSGLYGAIFAQRASSLGKKVLVIEKRPNIAGNIY